MKKDTSIQIIRIFSMTMIVICHLLSIMQNYYMIALSQFFSIGVYIFLFISGFLYGKKEINLMSKRLVKDNKETIEAKDVKLLNNMDDVEKLD